MYAFSYESKSKHDEEEQDEINSQILVKKDTKLLTKGKL